MSSLVFKKPILIDGLPDEAAEEWIGLTVGLASAFPLSIGYLGHLSARVWDEQSQSYKAETSCNTRKVSEKLAHDYLWVSKESLVQACKYGEFRRRLLLDWLNNHCTQEFFAVDKSVAEYLP